MAAEIRRVLRHAAAISREAMAAENGGAVWINLGKVWLCCVL